MTEVDNTHTFRIKIFWCTILTAPSSCHIIFSRKLLFQCLRSVFFRSRSYKMDVTTLPVMFDRGTATFGPPQTAETGTAENRLGHSIKKILSLRVVTEDSETFTSLKGFLFNHTHTVGYAVPLILSVTSHFQISHSRTTKQTTTKTTTRSLDISLEVLVPPLTTVTATVMFSNRKMVGKSLQTHVGIHYMGTRGMNAGEEGVHPSPIK